MDINVNVPAIEKLLDYAASGVGSIAGPMLAPWKAGQEAKARLRTVEGEAEAQRIHAEGHATSTQIIAAAQEEARSTLISPQATLQGEVGIGELITQRIQFQEEKRQANIGSVVRKAASQLGDGEVQDHEVDHDWTARYFADVQDVSSEELRNLWSRILAGQVARPGSTSIRTLSVLKNLNQDVAGLFAKLCSICLFLREYDLEIVDARVPFIGGYREGNALQDYDIDYGSLNLLNEHGLIISDYESWGDYNAAITPWPSEREEGMWVFPFTFQDKYWILIPMAERSADQEFRLDGVALTMSGQELSKVVTLSPNAIFVNDLKQFFCTRQLKMEQVDSLLPRKA